MMIGVGVGKGGASVAGLSRMIVDGHLKDRLIDPTADQDEAVDVM